MDARSLLRAKKAEAKVEHPHASYTSGQLRCTICAVPVKQWEAHLLTKQHRASVARERATEEKKKASTKRPAENSARGEAKRTKVESDSSGPSGLPAGFFDGPRPSTKDDDDDEEADENEATEEAGQSSKSPIQSQDVQNGKTKKAEPTGDYELDAFLQSLDEPEPLPMEGAGQAGSSSTGAGRRGGGARSPSPSLGVASYSAAPVRNIPEPQKDEEADEEEEEPEETEEEKRARIAREEREEIMGRLEEEQRAQEDADSRVEALKARMEMLKARRKSRPPKENSKGGKQSTAKVTKNA